MEFRGIELDEKMLYFLSLLYLTAKYYLKSEHHLNKTFNHEVTNYLITKEILFAATLLKL